MESQGVWLRPKASGEAREWGLWPLGRAGLHRGDAQAGGVSQEGSGSCPDETARSDVPESRLGGEEEEENAGLGWAGSSSHKLLSSP